MSIRNNTFRKPCGPFRIKESPSLQQTVPQNNTAGLNIPTGALLTRYLEQGKKSGQVVGELLDKVLIETRPVQNGDGYEVYYIRQIIEKARVPDLYTFGTDDTGQAVPVRIEVVSPKPLGPT